MIALLYFFLTLFASPLKSKGRLEAENAALRHQLIVLQRVNGRVQLTNGDRLFLVMLYCQSASKFDPRSASNFDPLERRVLGVALAPSELVGVAETARARVA